MALRCERGHVPRYSGTFPGAWREFIAVPLGSTHRQFGAIIEASHRGAYELVALMHFNFDTIVLVGLVGVIGAVAIVVGATAAIEAVSQARSPVPTPDEELLLLQPMRVSVIVDGQGRMSEPLPVRFTLADPAVTLIQIELANQLDREARTAQCVKTGPKVFVAEVEPRVVQRWYNANPYWDGETKRLPICVFFTGHGQAGCRTIWVTMTPINMSSRGLLSDVMDFAWYVEGPCRKTAPTQVPRPSRTRTRRL